MSLLNLLHARQDNLENIVTCEYHASNILNKKRLKDYKTTLSTTEDDAVIVLQTTPLANKSGLFSSIYHINKADTTIFLIDVSYTSPDKNASVLKDGNIKWKTNKVTAQLEFEEFDEKLFMSKNIYTADVHCTLKDGKEEDIIYYVDSRYKGIGKYNTNIKRPKLNGFSRELYEMPNRLSNDSD